MEAKECILLVEDDKEIAQVISDFLRKEGYQVTWASTGREGWEDFSMGNYQLVLVDLMLPEMDGYKLCEHIRFSSDVPMLILSAHQEDHYKVKGLKTGADDYMTKPFSLAELSARIESHLRRFRRYRQIPAEGEGLSAYSGGLSIDFELQRVFIEGEEILLTGKELALLLLIARHPYRTFSKKELYEQIWQQTDVAGNNTVTVHIKSLRGKIKDTGKEANYVQTVWGSGYRFIGELME